MIVYSKDRNTANYNGFKFKKDPKSGYYLSTRKTDIGHRERLHVYVWRTQNGVIPCGFHIHHIDGNKDNNDISNLSCILGRKHISYHSQKYAENHKEEILNNLLLNAIPKANEWHKSEEGKKWHKIHGKETFGNQRIIEKTCEQCGKTYKTRISASNYGRFCSNNCRAAFRRHSGIDNEKRECIVCGNEFTVNKYAKTMCCSKSCAAKLRWKKLA